MSAMRTWWVLSVVVIAWLCAGEVLAQSDWDLYMLRLVNRARQDSAGEPGRISSWVTDARAAVAPLAYDLTVAQAAKNHNDWMYANLGSIASSNVPDSFTHYETRDGTSSGVPATSTSNFTGADIGDRISAVGYVWGRAGENISYGGNTESIPINQARIDAHHKGWWESTGHRNNMLDGSFTVFGHHAESWAFTPPLGGITAPIDNLSFATQNFARPYSGPMTYILGLLYDDKDSSGGWTPRDTGASLREGLSSVSFQVLYAGTSTVVATGTTMANGAFSVNIGDGTYDVVFTDSVLPGGTFTISSVTVSGANTDAGDHNISDTDNDGVPNLSDKCSGTPPGEQVNTNGCSCSQLDCDDGNPCTDDSCGNGNCQYTNNSDSCDDGDACTENDTCSNGTCSGTAKSCDDGDACTENDTCISGTCSGTPKNCDDGNPCTDDSCGNGNCQYTNNSDSCDDGDACTENDTCSNGTCSGTPKNCSGGSGGTPAVSFPFCGVGTLQAAVMSLIGLLLVQPRRR